ncbi:MAG: START-like domain-containing protein [Bacteroidia bacterium]|nr:START-like domain-containing protein [Bacteroidia bacterium]
MSVKQKYELEYVINASPKVLFSRLSTPGGLSEWFADDVNIEGSVLTFMWDKTIQKAELLCQKENRSVRYRWLDDPDPKSYFEFRITQDPLTNDVSLSITDFAEENEIADSKGLWDKQISQLFSQLGSA